ncbi:tRNA (adenosine(37)-N6)-threonylcarbamoyltransferase complex dimerization subunit type 1 TsaB [Candidatus Omnitrophota bacterium]
MVGACNYSRQMRHSKNLIHFLDKMLHDANLSMDKIDHIACGVGPGSYTGLRIGHSFVKGLALSRNIPVFPFSSLELIAYNIKPKHDKILVCINARRGKLYCGVFVRSNDALQQKGSDTLITIGDAFDLIKNEGPIAITGDALDKHTEEFMPFIDKEEYMYSSRYWFAKAENIACIIAQNKKIPCVNSEKLVPHYLRITEAEEKFGRVM